MAQYKRQTAYKLKIGDLNIGKRILDEGRFSFLELGNKQIMRINIVANVVDKFVSEEKQYISLTIDDASGQIRIKIFGDSFEKFSGINQGDTVMVIGMLRFFNDELYILPEIIKNQDPRYLLVRKLELEKEKPKEMEKQEILALKDQIIDKIKQAEDAGGVEIEKIILELHASPDIINQEIQRALEQGMIYEPRPGILRFLG